MAKNYKPKTAEELAKEINDLTKGMEDKIESYFVSPEKLQEHLEFMSTFHNYSLRNMTLIDDQFKGARAVGSFQYWKEKGASVQKGEKGIKVLVPTPVQYFSRNNKQVQVKYATPDEKKRIANGSISTERKLFFKIGHVFEYTQTNAREKSLEVSDLFSNYHREGTVENDKEFMQAFEKLADKVGVKLLDEPPFNYEFGTAKGGFFRDLNAIALNPRNTMADNIPVMVHELAHAELHSNESNNGRGKELSTNEKEFQAEMVAYVVGSHYGIEMEKFSVPYLAGWTKDAGLQDKEKLLNEVKKTASEFIDVIDGHFSGIEQSKELKQDNSQDTMMLVEYGSLSNASLQEVSLDELKTVVATRIGQYPVETQVGYNEKLKEFFVAEQFTDKAVELINKEMDSAFIVLDKSEIEQPTMLVQWSESDKFQSNELIRFSEANERFAEVSNSKEEMGYYKTRYHVLIPDDAKVEMINPDRHDIGDGYYKNAYQQLNAELNLKPAHHDALLRDMAIHAHEKTNEPQLLIRDRSTGFESFGKVNATDFYGQDTKKEDIKYTAVFMEEEKLQVVHSSFDSKQYAHPLHHIEKEKLVSPESYKILENNYHEALFKQESTDFKEILPRIKAELKKEEKEQQKNNTLGVGM
ncbi:LPD25 domain-containing protein [Sporosarcina siberiensis]|uniref:LPD25 domain-containing protein n=1 Tax=Sporosarcina siberiensis TaxID=1365606 RepID=A0ABW4SAS9_9BACL